jgi:hypothetical protein
MWPKLIICACAWWWGRRKCKKTWSVRVDAERAKNATTQNKQKHNMRDAYPSVMHLQP